MASDRKAVRLIIETEANTQGFRDVDQAAGMGLAAVENFADATLAAFKGVGNEATKSAKETQRAFRALGVESTEDTRKRLMALVDAFNQIRKSGTASAKDVTNAQEALRTQIARIKGIGDTALDEFANDAARAERSSLGLGRSLKTAAAGLLAYVGVTEAARGIASAFNEAEQGAFRLKNSTEAAAREFGAATGSLAEWDGRIESINDHLRIYSEGAIKSATARTIDMTKRLGLSADQMEQVIKRAGDLGSGQFELADSVERVSAALRGEAEASEALGLTLNENYVAAWYKARGATQGAWKDLTDVQKAQVRYMVFLEQSESKLGQAAESIKTVAGAWTYLKGKVADSIGDNEKLAKVLRDLADALAENADEIAAFVGDMVGLIADIAEFTVKNKELVAVLAGAGGLVVAIGALTPGITALKAAFGGLSTLNLAGSFTGLASGAGTAQVAISGLIGILTGPVGLIAAMGFAATSVVALADAYTQAKEAEAEADRIVAASQREQLANYDKMERNIAEYNRLNNANVQIDEHHNIVLDEKTKRMQKLDEEIRKLGRDSAIPKEVLIKARLDREKAQREIDELKKTERKKIIIDIVTSGSSTDILRDLGGSQNFIKLEDDSMPTGFATGGYIRRRGFLGGYGGGDRIRALLEPGEYVVRKEAVRMLGLDLLEKINRGVAGIRPQIPTIPQRFATGGMVSAPSLPHLGTINLNLGGGETATVYGDDRAVAAIKRAVSLEQRRRSSS